MTVFSTRRFGDLSIPDTDVFAFPRGLPGFPGLNRFVLLPNPSGGPFQWLQSTERSELAFAVCDPLLFAPDYRVEVRREDLEDIGLERLEAGFVLSILTVPEDPKKMTANLLGPLVFNPGAMKVKQVVLAKEPSWARVPVFGGKP
ncbi:MAG: flagellar assembly protein FliW [Planctomycetes bacterium]|nr:flagellar assembly protein FliW [Planctomycetota bacterium]